MQIQTNDNAILNFKIKQLILDKKTKAFNLNQKDA